MSQTSDSMSVTDNTCVVCFKIVDTFSIGVCDHPVCYECSTRMRVLCLQNECPICRQDMPKVIFTKKVKPFKAINSRSYPIDQQYKILFDGGSVQNAFLKLLKHSCPVCGNDKTFETFQSLSTHVRREHDLYFCDLCADNLKIFTHERRAYNRQQLAYHKRKGDPDDKSHKGHPLCEFCDQRYMDSDELFRHLRKDHLFCHFCDADGLHQYYSSYDYLRDHFKKEHFLCEEGPCYEEKFTSAFRSEIDLKAHKASIHSKTLGKQAAKQARTLEFEFTLAPRPRERAERNHRGADRLRSTASPLPLRCNHAGACNCIREDVSPNVEAPITSQLETRHSTEPQLNLSDFPSLGGSSASSIMHLGSGRGRGTATGVTICTSSVGRPPLSITDENFPALSDSTPSQSHKVWLSVNSRVQQDRPTSAPTNFSIRLNSRQRGGGSLVASNQSSSNQNLRIHGPGSRLTTTSELEQTEFPALTPLDAYRGTKADQWVTGSGANQAHSKVNLLSAAKAAQFLNSKPPTKQSAPKPQTLGEDDFPSLVPAHTASHSPSKKVSSSNVKASSITVPITTSWSEQLKEVSPVPSSDSEAHSNMPSSSKARKKKKKVKNNNVPEVARIQIESKSSLAERSHSLNQAESNKIKKKKQKSQQHQEQLQDLDKTKDKPKKQLELKKSVQCNDKLEKDNANQENTAPCPEPSHNGVGRKRSELEIENLQISDEQNITENPTNRLLSILRGDNYVSKAVTSKVNPPPGFEIRDSANKPAGPPPGFSVKINSLAQPSSNQLTFTNSSGESYPILPSMSSNLFVQPPDFQRRNAALMAKVMETLEDPNLLGKFRQLSISFRQGHLSSSSYYKHCFELMGKEAFYDFFPEMLVLLPEIDRQQDLLSVYKQLNSGENSLFEVCATCLQVLSPSDLRAHASTHTLQNHFPALSTTDSNVSSAWGRK